MDREAYAKKNKYYSYTKKKVTRRLMPALRRIKSILRRKVKTALKEKVSNRMKYLREVDISSDTSFVYESSNPEPGSSSSDDMDYNLQVDDDIEIRERPKQIENVHRNLWAEAPKAEKLRKTLFNIQMMCENEQILHN